jgi:hypothetical protein
MKKLFPAARFHLAFSWFAKTIPLKTCGLVAVVSVAGCIATENRWQASQMRQQVMDYYNDQIMENLIRASKSLPFVHVDVTSLTTTDAASLTGTIGNGETRSNTRTSSAMVNAVGTLTRTVTRPFSYSVTPGRNTSLQIQASPVLGRLSADSVETSTPTPSPTPTPTPTPTPPFEESKITKTVGPDENVITTETELTPKPKSIPTPTPTPRPLTIYDLYERFLTNKDSQKALVANGPAHPKEGTYVPGTPKKWESAGRTQYYYIDIRYKDKYYQLCKSLFTKGQAQSIEKTIEAKANAAAQAAEARVLTR